MRSRRFRLLVVVCATVAAVAGAAPVHAQEAGGPAVGVRLVADGFTSPVALVSPPDGSGRLFIVDQIGLIRVLLPNGALAPAPFLDLRSRIVPLMPEFDERGALGLAFHPRYASNGRFFVFYTAPLRPGAPAGYDATSTIAEFRVSAADPNRADPSSERILLQVDKPHHCSHRFDLAGTGILLVPCAFIWPAVMVECCGVDQPTVTYPTRGVAELWTEPPAEQIDPLSSLVGRTRATLLATLGLPRTTTQLAAQLDLSPPAISHHLKVLKDTGLVTARRRGRMVLYRRTAAATTLLEAVQWSEQTG